MEILHARSFDHSKSYVCLMVESGRLHGWGYLFLYMITAKIPLCIEFGR